MVMLKKISQQLFIVLCVSMIALVAGMGSGTSRA